MMINLDQGVTRLDYRVSYPYSASTVFAAITDFPAYPWWQPDVVGIRAAKALPVGLGTQVVEVDSVMGRQTHVTLTVTEYEQDRLVTLQTLAGARPQVRQAYRLEPTGNGQLPPWTSTWNSTTFPSWPTTSSRPSSATSSSGSSTSSARSSPSGAAGAPG